MRDDDKHKDGEEEVEPSEESLEETADEEEEEDFLDGMEEDEKPWE